MAAPIRKTAEYHKSRGNYRPKEHARPDVPVTIPDMPRGMTDRAKRYWKKISVLLEELNYIANIDFLMLRVLCEACDHYHSCQEEIAKYGLMVEEPTSIVDKVTDADGNIVMERVYKTVANPALKVQQEMWGRLDKLSRKFGLTVCDRTGLVNHGTKQTTESNEDIVGILKFDAG